MSAPQTSDSVKSGSSESLHTASTNIARDKDTCHCLTPCSANGQLQISQADHVNTDCAVESQEDRAQEHSSQADAELSDDNGVHLSALEQRGVPPDLPQIEVPRALKIHSSDRSHAPQSDFNGMAEDGQDNSSSVPEGSEAMPSVAERTNIDGGFRVGPGSLQRSKQPINVEGEQAPSLANFQLPSSAGQEDNDEMSEKDESSLHHHGSEPARNDFSQIPVLPPKSPGEGIDVNSERSASEHSDAEVTNQVESFVVHISGFDTAHERPVMNDEKGSSHTDKQGSRGCASVIRSSLVSVRRRFDKPWYLQ